MKKIILLSYYGAKNRISGCYPKPKHGHIIEPFAGSAGYACRYPDLQVTLIERDQYVADALSYIVRTNPDVIAMLPILQPSETLDDYPWLETGARNVISFWLNKGTAGGSKRLSQWATKYPSNSFYWGERCRDRLAEAAACVKHWTIICGDYKQAPDTTADWFIDPPYQSTGKHYRHNAIDYNELSAWCRSRRGHVIVCENEKADWLPFERLREISGAAKNGTARKRSIEAAWISNNEKHELTLF